MNSMLLGILAIAIILSIVWWIHLRNGNLYTRDPDRSLPPVFISTIFFAGLVVYKIVEDMQVQKNTDLIYVISTSFFALTLFGVGVYLLSLWLEATSARSATNQ